MKQPKHFGGGWSKLERNAIQEYNWQRNDNQRRGLQTHLDLFENSETIKDIGINLQLKLGHYPVKQKPRPVPLHLQEDVRRELKKLLKSGYRDKIKDVDEDCFVSPVVNTVKNYKSVKATDKV